jgi:hypothetical protein
MRTGAISRFRKAVVGLLVLALFALSAAPAMAMAPVDLDHHATHDCGLPGDDGAAPAAAVPAAPDHGRTDSGGHRHDAPPGLACCVAFQCPMLLGGLPAATAQPSPSPGPSVRSAFGVRRHVGIDIAPALPPPREAA